MTKKIKFMALSLIFIIAVSAITAVGVIQGQAVSDVEGVHMIKNDDSSFTLEWRRVHKAAGYRVYLYNEDKKEYQKLLDITDGNIHSYKFENLDKAKVHKLKVSAYKIYNKKEYESNLSDEIIAYSLPPQVHCEAISSAPSTLSIYWDRIANAAGYEIEYSKNDNFSNSQTKSTDNKKDLILYVENLNPSDMYYARARAYINVDSQQIYGEWGKTSGVKIRDKILTVQDLDPDKPMVALSFDDGPAFDYEGKNATARILNVLEKNGARATFFMVGDRVNSETAALLKKELKLGCELGNHTISHSHYGSDVTASDISKASSRIKKYCGSAPTAFRCPGGKITKTIVNECKKENMPLAYWSVDTEDWKNKDSKKIYKNIMNGVYDGAIILMHDIYPSTADAVEKAVPALIKKGYQIVTVSELITAKSGNPPKAGKQYVDAVTINNDTH